MITSKAKENIRRFIAHKASALMKHEERSFAHVGLDESKYHIKTIEGRTFVVVTTNVFFHVLDNVLANACEMFPDRFGKDDVDEVLRALYDAEPFGEIQGFEDFLKMEQFAWILEVIGDEVNEKILRVELFRKVDTVRGAEKKTEFTGGVLHAFKHFIFNGTPLSTKKENKELTHPSTIIEYLIYGFFLSDLEFTDDAKCFSRRLVSEGTMLRFDFFYEIITGIFFVNSMRPS